MKSLRLDALRPAFPDLNIVGDPATLVTGITQDSRKVTKGSLFVARTDFWSHFEVLQLRPERPQLTLAPALVLAPGPATVTIDGAPAGRVGEHYARTEGPASRVLHELAPRAWYVDLDGVTRFGVRPAVEYTGAAPRVDVRPAAGCV